VRAAFCTVLFALRGLYVLIYFFNLVFFSDRSANNSGVIVFDFVFSSSEGVVGSRVLFGFLDYAPSLISS
jgi:hypothetical protein